jgi:multiple sugar transport system substrate-binding protein
VKRFFAGAIVLFGLLYVLAETTLERPPDDGVVRLRWATDPNPARNLQTAIFGKRQVRLYERDVADWPALAGALASPAEQGAGSRAVLERLGEFLPQEARGAVDAVRAGRGGENHRAVILQSLNRLLDTRDLLRPADLERLDLSYDARLLRDRPRAELTEVEAFALNRRALEAALPGTLRRAVRVEVSVESGAAEKLIVQCATGTGPDVIDVYGLNQMLTYVQTGILVDLTPFAGEMGFGPENTFAAIKGNLLVDGRQYRFPCNVWANCVVYNRKVFDDHGVPYPREGWTWDDFIRAGRDLLAKPAASGRKHLAVANWNSVWMYEDMLLGHGGRCFSPDGLASTYDAPESVAAMQLYHDLMHVHEVIPTPAEAAAMSSQGGWGSGGINWFCDGQAGMVFIGRWLLNRLGNYPELSPHLGAARLPRVGERPSAGQTDCRGAGINVKGPHREAALKFLRYLASVEYGRVIVHDGDALPPNPALARTGSGLVNAVAPDPAFHQPFVDAMEDARPLAMSPFIDGAQVERWLRERIDKVENKVLAPAEALRGLAAEIDERIRRNLERRSDLRRKFEKVTGRKWTADWHRRSADARP